MRRPLAFGHGIIFPMENTGKLRKNKKIKRKKREKKKTTRKPEEKSKTTTTKNQNKVKYKEKRRKATIIYHLQPTAYEIVLGVMLDLTKTIIIFF